MENPKPLVLIVEQNEALAELNTFVLEGAGYRVETPPQGASVLTFVNQTHPQVILLDINPNSPEITHLLTQLQASPNTRDIPVVVVTSDEYLAALAKTVPVTSAFLVHPYHIQELENAIARALHNPPPSAVLPAAPHPPSPVVQVACEALAKNARRLVVQTVGDLQRIEPYQSRLAASLPDLVDNLAKMLEAINQGLRRSLPAGEVFSVPAIRRSIEEHVQLRKAEGVGAASTVREYQLLSLHTSRLLASLVEHGNLTVHDFIQLGLEVQQYVDELIRQVINYSTSETQSESTPPDQK